MHQDHTTIKRLNHIAKNIDNNTLAEIIIKLYDYLNDYEQCQRSILYTEIATLLFNTLNDERNEG